MAKERRRGNREARKPKAAKSAVAAPISLFATKTASGAASTLKRKR
jgi:hypothetical protein